MWRLLVTIFAAWELLLYSYVRAERYLPSDEDDCSFSCCSTLQHYNANGKKRLNDQRWREDTLVDHQSVSWFFFCVLFSMSLQRNYFCEWLAVDFKKRGTRTLGRNPMEDLLSLLSHIMQRSYILIKHATDLSIINKWMLN